MKMIDEEFEIRELNKVNIEQNIKTLVKILSPREFQVLCQLFSNYSQREIATNLGISRGTIRMYILRIRKKYRRIDELN